MALKRIQFEDQKTSLFQDNVDQALIPIQQSPFVGGVYLRDIVLASGSNTIQHTLTRTPIVWAIGDTNSAVTIYRTSWDRSVINLTASGAVTISLWVN